MAYFKKSSVLKFFKKYEEAVQCYDIALKINPNYSAASTAKNDASALTRPKKEKTGATSIKIMIIIRI